MARILIANDDEDLLELCRNILEDCGHVIQTTADGRLALERIRKWHPDMILIDWVMPHVNGAEAVAILRGDPSTRDIPILMMSGSPGADLMARDVGADAFLRKPFVPAELAARTELLLGRATQAPVAPGP
jgi:CheY-like chemotaxis protein